MICIKQDLLCPFLQDVIQVPGPQNEPAGSAQNTPYIIYYTMLKKTFLSGSKSCCLLPCIFKSTWSHKNSYLCALFSETVFTYLLHGSEFKYTGSVPKNEGSILLEICPTPNRTLNLHDSVNKYKTDIRMYLLMLSCYMNFLICRLKLFCRSVITLDSNRSSSPPKYFSVLCELPNKPTVYENT